MRRDRTTLAQILERIDRIEASGVDRERFQRNEWDQDAVVRNLEVIGEAIQRLSDEVRARPSEVRLSGFTGLRDIIIHGYDSLNLDRTWVIVERDLPSLKAEVRRVLKSLDADR